MAKRKVTPKQPLLRLTGDQKQLVYCVFPQLGYMANLANLLRPAGGIGPSRERRAQLRRKRRGR